MSSTDLTAVLYNAQLLKMTFVKVATDEGLDVSSKTRNLLGVTMNLETAAQAGAGDTHFNSEMVDICADCFASMRGELPEAHLARVSTALFACLKPGLET